MQNKIGSSASRELPALKEFKTPQPPCPGLGANNQTHGWAGQTEAKCQLYRWWDLPWRMWPGRGGGVSRWIHTPPGHGARPVVDREQEPPAGRLALEESGRSRTEHARAFFNPTSQITPSSEKSEQDMESGQEVASQVTRGEKVVTSRISCPKAGRRGSMKCSLPRSVPLYPRGWPWDTQISFTHALRDGFKIEGSLLHVASIRE